MLCQGCGYVAGREAFQVKAWIRPVMLTRAGEVDVAGPGTQADLIICRACAEGEAGVLRGLVQAVANHAKKEVWPPRREPGGPGGRGPADGGHGDHYQRDGRRLS